MHAAPKLMSARGETECDVPIGKELNKLILSAHETELVRIKKKKSGLGQIV